MKKYRLEITFTVVLVSLTVVIIILLGGWRLFEDSKKRNYSYLLFQTDNLWKIDGDTIVDVTDEKEKNSIIKERKFDIYSGNQYVANSNMIYFNSFWRFPNQLTTYIKDPMLGYSGNQPIEVVNTSSVPLTESDLTILNNYTKQKNYTISNLNQLTFQSKVSFDFDDDGKEETLYIASDFYTDEDFSSKDKSFQIILYYDGVNSQVIRNDFISVDDEWSGDYTAHEFFSIIKLPNQDNYGIVLNKYRSMGGLNYCPTLYLLKEGKFEQVKTCKEMES